MLLMQQVIDNSSRMNKSALIEDKHVRTMLAELMDASFPIECVDPQNVGVHVSLPSKALKYPSMSGMYHVLVPIIPTVIVILNLLYI